MWNLAGWTGPCRVADPRDVRPSFCHNQGFTGSLMALRNVLAFLQLISARASQNQAKLHKIVSVTTKRFFFLSSLWPLPLCDRKNIRQWLLKVTETSGPQKWEETQPWECADFTAVAAPVIEDWNQTLSLHWSQPCYFFPFSYCFVACHFPIGISSTLASSDPAKQRVGRMRRGLMGLWLRMGFGGAVKLFNNYTQYVSGVERQLFMLVLRTAKEL